MRYNPFKHYDKHGCLKIPLTLYLALAYLLKGYVIWIMSLSYRQDPAALLNIFYPNRNDFYDTLLVGIPAIICAIIFCFRHVNMPKIIEWSWFKIRWFLMLSTLIQLGLSLGKGNVSWYNLQHPLTHSWVLLDFSILFGILIYLMLNQYVKDVSNEFPYEEDAS